MFRERSLWINVRGTLIQPNENIIQRFSEGSHITNIRRMLHKRKHATTNYLYIYIKQTVLANHGASLLHKIFL